MSADPSQALRIELLELVAQHGDAIDGSSLEERGSTRGVRGMSMGAIVDALVARGHEEASAEAAVWSALSERRLTPVGYMCRTLKVRDGDEYVKRRSYDFVLIPWAPQLDLGAEPAASVPESKASGQ